MAAMRTHTLALSILLLSSAVVAQDKPASSAEQLKPMSAAADPAFEVAAIKPADPNDHSSGFQLRGRRIYIENEPVTMLICFAYSVQKSQIVNAPPWFDDARWDINGVPDNEGYPNQKQYQRMVEKLLKDRFALQIHHDQRELSVYALTLSKGGPKLDKSKSDPEAPLDQTGHGANGQQSWSFKNNGMADLAQFLQEMVGKPVINQTNLPGRFDFNLLWTRDELRSKAEPDAAPGLFTAIQEELGLKLEPTRAPADVIVIDHAERPSQN